jgi:hypothetical protein
MLFLLGFFFIVSFFLRIYYYHLAKNKSVTGAIFLVKNYWIGYLIPLATNTNVTNIALRKKANLFLYIFYLLFFCIFLYAIAAKL